MACSTEQSTQRYPLTRVLGSEANVRILRELSRHSGQLSRPELRKRTGLSRASVWHGLANLEQVGIVEIAGDARTRLYGLAEHPLRPSLDALFEAEEARFLEILETTARAARRWEPMLRSCWICG